MVALVLVTAAAGISYGVLRLTYATGQRQQQATDDRRAHYVAEAGLSEAYYALGCGYTGAIGSIESPVRVGDGLLWVTATPLEDGLVELESTALCGTGRSRLAVTVAPRAVPVGLFSDQLLRTEGRFLIDGYDSTIGSYAAQAIASPGAVAGSEDEIRSATEEDAGVASEAETSPTEDGCATLSDSFTNDLLGIGESSLRVVEDSTLLSTDSSLAKSSTDGFGGWTLEGGSSSTTRDPLAGPTTGSLALMGSNGDIHLNLVTCAEGAIYGAAVPGVGGALEKAGAVLVSGVSTPRSAPVELSPVEVPELSDAGPVELVGSTPKVLPPMDSAYGSIRVATGATLVVQGPSVLVAESLVLEAGSHVVLDNSAGSIDLVVRGLVDLRPGATVSVTAEGPGSLSLQVAGAAEPVRLAAKSQFRGVVYAPERSVRVEAGFELYGTVVAGALELGDGVRMHFDHGLYAGGSGLDLPTLLLWELRQPPTAMALDRRSAETVLGTRLTQAPPPHTQLESTSWTFTTEYVATDGSRKRYSGPYEDWNSGDVQLYLSARLTEPTAPVEGEWMLTIEFDDVWGRRTYYEGTVRDFPYYSVRKVFLRVVTPPPSLLQPQSVDIVATIGG